jgi:hypothetical protein
MFTYTYDWTMSSVLVNDLTEFGEIDFKYTNVTIFWNFYKQMGIKNLGKLKTFEYGDEMSKYLDF